MTVSKANLVFLAIILPLGIVMVIWTKEIAQAVSLLFDREVTASNLAVLFLVLSFLLLTVFSEKNDSKDDDA
ncbi:hypothetical protein MD273_08190 [Marinobacter pelagius]|nr:hypothetical protein [Marinobacter sp. C7]